MKSSIIAVTLAVASTAAAMPASSPAPFVKREIEVLKTYVDEASGITFLNYGYQGDGFYSARVNESNIAVIEFTPNVELDAVSPNALQEYQAAVELRKRDLNLEARNDAGITCAGDNGHTPDMDWANVRLAQNGNGITYNANHWGWVFNHGEVSYFCNYLRQVLGYQQIIDHHIRVSNRCGGSHRRGFQRSRFINEAQDLAVGRTWNGNNFCTTTFRP